MLDSQFRSDFIGGEKRSGIRKGVVAQLSIQQFQIESQILDPVFAEFHVGVTDPFGDNRRVAACDLEHFVGHIDPDHFPLWADNLRGDETDFSRAAAQIENRFAFTQITRWIAATVIALDYFLRNNFEIFGLVFSWTTKIIGAFSCTDSISLPDDGFSTLRIDHVLCEALTDGAIPGKLAI
jgi:hypothetical protein